MDLYRKHRDLTINIMHLPICKRDFYKVESISLEYLNHVRLILGAIYRTSTNENINQLGEHTRKDKFPKNIFCN